MPEPQPPCGGWRCRPLIQPCMNLDEFRKQNQSLAWQALSRSETSKYLPRYLHQMQIASSSNKV